MKSLYLLENNYKEFPPYDDNWQPVNLTLKDFRFFDENDKYVKKLDKYFRFKFYHIPFKYNLPSYPFKKVSSINDGIIIQSSGLENDWVYLYTNKIDGSFRLDFDLLLFSRFKEFQIAFKHQSVFERLRFRIIQNEQLVFEVVHGGVFYNNLITIPFTLTLNAIHHISILIRKQQYFFSVDGVTMMSVLDKHKLFMDGGLAIVMWDPKYPSNINCEITNMQLQIPQ